MDHLTEPRHQRRERLDQRRERLELIRGDIVQQYTDAIVNAANTTLLGGGGVDGAIHRAGGPAILAACRALRGCATGDAKLTTGGDLRARYVIHTVGPVYRDGRHGEAERLASAYRRSLEVATAHGVASLAFPSISTGAYGYPIADAAGIALNAVAAYLRDHAGIALVRFVLFSDADLAVYRSAAAALKI
ncbi:MAG: O-acetyl-ADP-ribose deacetylase [bacterium]